MKCIALFAKVSTLMFALIIMSCDKQPANRLENLNWADSAESKALELMKVRADSSVIHFLDSTFSTKSRVTNSDLFRKYAAKVNYYQYYDTSLSQRRLYVDSMIYISSRDKDVTPHEYTNSLFAMATLLQEQKRYNESFAYYYQGKTFAKGTLDSCSMSEFDNALGIIRYRQGRFKQAIPHLKHAYQDIIACRSRDFKYSFIQRQSVLNSIALSFEKSAQIDSAILYYHKALSFVESQIGGHGANDPMILVAKAVIEGNLGGAYSISGDADRAEKYLRSNISFNDRPGYGIEDAQTAKVKLAKLYLKQHRTKDAKALLDQLESDLVQGRGKSSYHSEIRGQWLALKSKYYEATKDVAQALIFARRSSAYSDSLDASGRTLKDIDVDQLLKDQHERFTIDLLRKDSELKTAYLTAMSFFFVTAATIAFSLLLSFKRSRRNVRDLTALNEQMKLALSALEISQQENTELMKIVAHDLRGPVGAMTAMADLLLLTEGRTVDDIELIQMIKQTGTHSLELVNNLMHFEQRQRTEILKERVNLGTLTKQCANMLSHKAMEKGQKILTDLQDVDLPLNYEKMWRVVSNLLSNAIKFSPLGGKIYVKLNFDQKVVRLSIRDEGIGISKEFGDSIFQSFTKSRRKGTCGEESFGLGLSITQQLVLAHGGRIYYNSEPNQGTTFFIEFDADLVMKD